MSTKVLVTGGAGYFGSCLVERLIARGNECVVFDIAENAQFSKDVSYVQGDVRNYDDALKAFEGVGIVHHNVAQVPLAKDHEAFRSVNIDGTRNVLRAALEAGVGKVVYTSSSAVFGVPDLNPVLESHTPKPGEEYGRAKYVGEELCHEFGVQGLDVSIVRPRTIMGHGRLGIFQILFEWIREGSNIPVLGDGSNVYQFVHADDMADACILAGERPGSEIYNIGAAEFGTMREVLQSLCEHAGTGSKVTGVPMQLAIWGMNLTSAVGLSPLGAYHSLMYGRSMYFDITKAKTELGWNPTYSNAAMFQDSYDWYLANRDQVLENKYGHSPHKSPLKQGVLNIVKRII